MSPNSKLLGWVLCYLLLESDVNRNWHVREMQQDMPSRISCLRTAAKLPQLSTVRRQFIDVRCERKAVVPEA